MTEKKPLPDISPERARELLEGERPSVIKLDPDVDPIW